jgi:hypothetical protein
MHFPLFNDKSNWNKKKHKISTHNLQNKNKLKNLNLRLIDLLKTYF